MSGGWFNVVLGSSWFVEGYFSRARAPGAGAARDVHVHVGGHRGGAEHLRRGGVDDEGPPRLVARSSPLAFSTRSGQYVLGRFNACMRWFETF